MAYTLIDSAYSLYSPSVEFGLLPPKKTNLQKIGGFAKRNAGKLAAGGIVGGIAGAAALRYGPKAIKGYKAGGIGRAKAVVGYNAKKDIGKVKRGVQSISGKVSASLPQRFKPI